MDRDRFLGSNLQDGVSEANIYTGYTGYYFYSFLELKIVNDAIILLNDERNFVRTYSF